MRKPKQFILMMTDSQRKDMVGVYGRGQTMATPALDEIAKKGLRFERAYCCQPVCGPARSAIFTGNYPHTNGMLGNCMSLSEQTKTIGQRLTDAQVHSCYIGKWHLDGGDYFGNGQCPVGWDSEYWYDMRNYLDELTEDERLQSRNFQSCFEERGIKAEFTYAYRCTERAIDFLCKHQEDDYFLVISYDEPHDPFLAPKSFFEPYYEGGVIKKENEKVAMANLPEHVRLWHDKYQAIGQSAELGLLGCNAFIDTQIGRVLAAIDLYADQACLLYTSDHGESLGSHGIHSKGPAMYDEITNIPFILHYPGQTPGDTADNLPVSHADIVPTVLDYFGVEQPLSLDGQSLLPLLPLDRQSEVYCQKEENGVAIEFTRYEVDHDGFGGFQPIRCFIKKGKKLVINLLTEDELYDLDADPQEMCNLIWEPEYALCRNELHDDLLDWMNRTRDPFRGYYWARRSWRPEKIASWDCDGMTRRRYTEADEVKQLDYLTGLEVTTRVRKN